MPALVNNKVGSPWGTSEDEATMACPFEAKKSKNWRRISLLFIGLGLKFDRR
jgi:hypothetical protein